MADHYGSDFITVTDAEGAEYELEVLSSLEYNGSTYLATIPAEEGFSPEVIIFKSVEEDDEPILCIVDDDEEFQAVNALIMESLFQDSETE